MAPISCSVLLIFFLVLVQSFVSLGDVTVWPIWDLENPKVVSIAKFSVARYNKYANKTLQFVTVFDGDYSILRNAKSNYRVYLDISATDSGVVGLKNYPASVLYRPRRKKNSMKLEHFSTDEGEAFGGGMWPIEDLNNRLVLFVAKFAVEEYNKKANATLIKKKKKANATLQFETIIKGKEHMVARSIYHLLISAKDSSAPKKYETAVSFISWSKKSFKLESFKNYQSQSLFSNN